MTFIEIIISISVMVLLPIVPAYILYKAFPGGSKTDVGGSVDESNSVRKPLFPFNKMDFKLKGAFAAYFIVLMITGWFGIPYFHELNEKKCKPLTIMGYLELDNEKFNDKDLLIAVKPPHQSLNPETGWFSIKDVFIEKHDKLSGMTIIIQKNGYQSKRVDILTNPLVHEGFEDYKIEYLDDELIKIGKKIELKKKVTRIQNTDLIVSTPKLRIRREK